LIGYGEIESCGANYALESGAEAPHSKTLARLRTLLLKSKISGRGGLWGRRKS
jgi:hypothetical protein